MSTSAIVALVHGVDQILIQVRYQLFNHDNLDRKIINETIPHHLSCGHYRYHPRAFAQLQDRAFVLHCRFNKFVKCHVKHAPAIHHDFHQARSIIIRSPSHKACYLGDINQEAANSFQPKFAHVITRHQLGRSGRVKCTAVTVGFFTNHQVILHLILHTMNLCHFLQKLITLFSGC